MNGKRRDTPAYGLLAKYGRIWLLIAVPFLSLIAYQLHEAHVAAEAAAATTTKNLSLVLESELQSNFAAAERNVADTAAGIDAEAMRPEQAGKFRQVINQRLKARQRDAAAALRIFAANGDILYTSRDDEKPANIADRAFFQTLKANPVSPTIFSEVVFGRFTGRPAMIVAKAVRDRNDRFLGVAIAAIDLTVLHEHFRSIDVGSQGAVALRRLENGASVVRYPGPVNVDNKPAPNLPVRLAILAHGPQGTIQTESPVDGVSRIYGYRTVGAFPFFVTLGIAANDYLAEWRRIAVISGLASGLFLAALAVVFYQLALAEAQRESVEKALRRNRTLLNQAQQIGKVGGWEYDVGTRRMIWTEQVFQIYEVAPEFDPNDIARSIAFYAPDGQAELAAAFERAASQGEPYDLELQFTGAQGTRKWVRTSARAEIVNGQVQRLVGDIQDITERKLAEVRIGFLATHDRLTELPNRELFFDRLSQAISRAIRKPERLAVLFLDLDDFKPINDAHGHHAGDLALITVARRLQACVRGMDTVARLGGDEFAIVLGDIESPEDARMVAAKMIASLSEPMKLVDGLEIRIGASIGIALYPDNGTEIDQLMQAADHAMYLSKDCGKNTCTFSRELVAAASPDAPWITLDQSHSTGVTIIDEQHQTMINIFNKLNTAFRNAQPVALTTRLLDELVDYACFHFETENRLMEIYDYPDQESHRKAHQQLLDEAMYQRGKFIRGGEMLVLQSLKDWVLLHIMRFDKMLAQYLLQQEKLTESEPRSESEAPPRPAPT